MKSLLDEISRMKIKSALNGFKEWREGIVERTFLKEIRSSTFEPVGGGGGRDSHIKRTGVLVVSVLGFMKIIFSYSYFSYFAECFFSILVDGQPTATLIYQISLL